jgi:thiazole synthase
LGSGKYSLELIEAAVRDAGAQMITLAVRRANTTEKENILDYIPQGVTLLPNTSGARNAEEAVRIARLARELGCGDFVKIEIMRDTKYLLPDNQETIKATEILAKEGFVVMPYMYPDLNAARDLVSAGAACVMPLASPIGSNKGLATRDFIQILIDEIDLPVIVDAGIGRPSQACEAMEMGAAAIMANTALATAGDLPRMAAAFRQAIEAGRKAYLSGLGRERLRPPDRLFAGLRGRRYGTARKPVFYRFGIPLSPGLGEKAPAGDRPRLPEKPPGVPARHGGAPVRGDGEGALPDGQLRHHPVHRPGRAGRPGARHLLHRGL